MNTLQLSRAAAGLAFALVFLLVSGCETPPPRESEPPVVEAPAEDPMIAVNTLHPEPSPTFAADRIASGDYWIPPWAKHLKGVKICLDPGHGGDAHRRGFKRGPTGVREAEMNLRIALYLRALLEHVGAEVKLTRETDVDSTLAERADVANDWGADLFISLHHNAVGKPEVNYTSVWYHGQADTRPSNLDLARYLSDGLYAHFPKPSFTEVPLKSDQLMYAGGFGVVANARVTAALIESSFFTNPEEEQRLRDPEYNFEEAYAIFMGLATYAHNGLPRARLEWPDNGVLRASEVNDAVLVFQLDDGLRGRRSWGHDRNMILSDTIVVRINGDVVEHAFTPGDYRLFVPLPPGLPPGEQVIEVQFTNKTKNSVLNPFFVLSVTSP